MEKDTVAVLYDDDMELCAYEDAKEAIDNPHELFDILTRLGAGEYRISLFFEASGRIPSSAAVSFASGIMQALKPEAALFDKFLKLADTRSKKMSAIRFLVERCLAEDFAYRRLRLDEKMNGFMVSLSSFGASISEMFLLVRQPFAAKKDDVRFFLLHPVSGNVLDGIKEKFDNKTVRVICRSSFPFCLFVQSGGMESLLLPSSMAGKAMEFPRVGNRLLWLAGKDAGVRKFLDLKNSEKKKRQKCLPMPYE